MPVAVPAMHRLSQAVFWASWPDQSSTTYLDHVKTFRIYPGGVSLLVNNRAVVDYVCSRVLYCSYVS